MNTSTLATRKHQPAVRIYNPADALLNIIDNLGSATPWAMLALCTMPPAPPASAARGNSRPAPRTVREIRAIAPRSAAC